MEDNPRGVSTFEELKVKLRSEYIDLFIISLGLTFSLSLYLLFNSFFLQIGTVALIDVGMVVLGHTIKKIIEIKKMIKCEKKDYQSNENQQSKEMNLFNTHKNSMRYLEEKIKKENFPLEEAIGEWEFLELCSSNHAIGSTKHDSYQFLHDCHDYLVDSPQNLIELPSDFGSLKFTVHEDTFGDDDKTDKQNHHTKSLKKKKKNV